MGYYTSQKLSTLKVHVPPEVFAIICKHHAHYGLAQLAIEYAYKLEREQAITANATSAEAPFIASSTESTEGGAD